MNISTYLRLRPYAFHLTARENLESIRLTHTLSSTSTVARRVGRDDLLTTRRPHRVLLNIAGTTVVLRDQAPLHIGNLELEAGWTFARFVEHVNSRVFFWPGTGSGPISYGQRHFERYAVERPVVLRVHAASILRDNPGVPPFFAKYNSGSPRCSGGRRSPRGPSTFLLDQEAPFRPSEVVELTFERELTLPSDTQLSDSPAGPWSVL